MCLPLHLQVHLYQQHNGHTQQPLDRWSAPHEGFRLAEQGYYIPCAFTFEHTLERTLTMGTHTSSLLASESPQHLLKSSLADQGRRGHQFQPCRMPALLIAGSPMPGGLGLKSESWTLATADLCSRTQTSAWPLAEHNFWLLGNYLLQYTVAQGVLQITIVFWLQVPKQFAIFAKEYIVTHPECEATARAKSIEASGSEASGTSSNQQVQQ